MSIAFVGAGPGATDLLTLRGLRHLERADIVIYAGSLVNPDLLNYCPKTCEIYDSATMHLDEVLEVMRLGKTANKHVVRLHTGDFSLYGTLREQLEALKREDIDFELVPGVSSFLGAASALGAEYTVPEISQSLIITRIAGRTPVPERESIRSFATHGTSMVIFLSVDRLEEIVLDLVAGGYSLSTPAAVVYKATWPEEQVVRGTLETIANAVKAAGIHKTALILVGDFLGEAYYASKLYDKSFETGYRHGTQD